MRKQLFNLAAVSAIMEGKLPRVRIPRASNLKKYYTPPRSMTPEEKEYYDKHKTLAGLYDSLNKTIKK